MNYEVDFLPVGDGSGDAIVVRYGDDQTGYRLHVIDGGRTDTATTIIEHIERFYSDPVIDHMVLSHADDDHACGLIGVLEKFTVRNLWMNRPWLYAGQVLHHFHGNFTLAGLIDDMKERHPYLVTLEEKAAAKGTQVHEVFQGARIGAFTVLAPSMTRYIDSISDMGKTPTSYRAEDAAPRFGLLRSVMEAAKNWLDERWDLETLAENTVTSASNESCVVQYAAFGKGILLTADVGPIGLHEAADYGNLLGLERPKFVQVPHHGSRHNVTPSVLDRWLGGRQSEGTYIGTAFCSVGGSKTDYPKPQVTNAFMRRGFRVYSTRNTWLSHYSGAGHPGAIPATPEEFSYRVEGL